MQKRQFYQVESSGKSLVPLLRRALARWSPMPNYNVISLSLLHAQNVLRESSSGARYKVYIKLIDWIAIECVIIDIKLPSILTVTQFCWVFADMSAYSRETAAHNPTSFMLIVYTVQLWCSQNLEMGPGSCKSHPQCLLHHSWSLQLLLEASHIV